MYRVRKLPRQWLYSCLTLTAGHLDKLIRVLRRIWNAYLGYCYNEVKLVKLFIKKYVIQYSGYISTSSTTTLVWLENPIACNINEPGIFIQNIIVRKVRLNEAAVKIYYICELSEDHICLQRTNIDFWDLFSSHIQKYYATPSG